MGNFEKLSVLVIVVIIVMILVVALYTWQDDGDGSSGLNAAKKAVAVGPSVFQEPDPEPWPQPTPDPEPTPDPIPFPDPEPDPTPDPIPDPTPDPKPIVKTEPISSEPWTYVIKSGDTLSGISERELGTVKRLPEIRTLNPGLDPLKIRPGDSLKMPPRGDGLQKGPLRVGPGGEEPRPSAGPSGGKIAPGETYITQAGDTLQAISKRAWGTVERWPELWARNLSAVPSIDERIPVGTRIFIPR